MTCRLFPVNEASNLTREYAGEEAVSFVNGVLGKHPKNSLKTRCINLIFRQSEFYPDYSGLLPLCLTYIKYKAWYILMP